ncbi:unnamed protein product, partial [Ectocarpus sp. 12 AP-2014]
HLRDHHARTSDECQAVMRTVERSLEGLVDKHFSVDAEPSRVSEMLLFHVMFSGQSYLECEHAQLVFGEGGARAVSFPVRKLCALLPLPRFAGLQPRLVQHVGLLASLWLPRDAASLAGFFQDSVELLQQDARGVFRSSGEGPRTGPSGHRAFFERTLFSLPGVHDKHHGDGRRAHARGSHAYSQLWSLLGRQLDKELRPDTQDLLQVSLKALLVLLENPPPAGAMPQLGISCVRLAGRALCPPLGADGSEAMDAGGASYREYPAMAVEHLAAIQDLATRCIRLVFPGSYRKPQPKKRKASRTSGARGVRVAFAGGLRRPRRRQRLQSTKKTAAATKAFAPKSEGAGAGAAAAATACLTSLSATLPCIRRWWASCQGYVDEVNGAARMNTTEAVALARAIAAAYASAVEIAGAGQHASAGKVSTIVAGASRKATAKDKTPRKKSGAETPRGWDAGTPRFGAGLTSPRPAAARRPVASSTAPPPVPRRFAAAVSALVGVPCVQPELVRALRVVLKRFPHAPIAVLRRAGPADQEHARGDLNRAVSAQGEGGRGGGREGRGGTAGEMAPPPPRPPSGKKKGRVSLEADGLRAAAAGGHSGARRNRGGSLLPGSALRGGGRASFARAEGLSKTRRRKTRLLAGRSGRGAPLPFSGDSSVREAIDAVLARARVAVEFFEADRMAERETSSGDGKGDGGGSDGVDRSAAVAGVQPGEVNGSSAGRLHLFLQHTAAVTCALRILAPYARAARVKVRSNGADEAGKKLEFGVRGQKRGSSTPRVASTWKRSPGTRKRSSAGDRGWPSLIGQLAEAFGAASRTVSRYKTSASSGGGQESGESGASAPRAVAGLWDMLVSCAADVPTPFIVRRPSGGNNEAGTGGRAAGSRGELPSSRLGTTIRSVAEKALEFVLAPGWGCANEALEGLVLTGTALGPAEAPAPFLLKCFLLAAALSKGSGPVDDAEDFGAAGVGGRRLRQRSSRGEDDNEEGRPKRKRARGDDRRGSLGAGDSGRENHTGGGGTVDNHEDGDDFVFDVEETFLAVLRHDGSALVTQCSVAALPTLSLCGTKRGECLSNVCSSSVGRFTEHAATCNWKTRWLPALLELCENGGQGGSDEVRLELASGLLRLGASLDRTARNAGFATEATAAAASALRRLQRPRHHTSRGGLPLGAMLGERVPIGPNVFVDMLPLWPALLKDKSVAVRAATARAVLAAAAAAPLSRLRAAGRAGAAVLRLLTSMLSCGDPEVSWVVAGGAGLFVAEGGNMLRAMYHYDSVDAAAQGARGEEMDVEEEEEEETCDAQEEEEREARSREKALSRFIETIGKMLQEHGDGLRLGRWQSLHEFTALLRALGSIGCESDPSDDLGRTVYLWTLIRLVDVWVDEGNECAPAAHEQIVRVCNHGKAPLPHLLRLPPVSASYLGGSGDRQRDRGERASRAEERGSAPRLGGGRGRSAPLGVVGLEMDSGSILAPLIEKLMETGHVEEFVEQALGSRNFRAFLEDSVAHVLPVFVAGSKAVAVEQLAALCDQFEVGDARGKDPPQRLLNRHLPHVLTDVLMRGRSAWTDEKSSPGLQFLLKYFPESTPKRLIEGVLPQILEQVSWQLCGPRREEATVALQAVAHISYQYAVSF